MPVGRPDGRTQRIGNQCNGDEGEVGHYQIERGAELGRISVADVGSIDDLHPVVAAKALVDLTVAHVDGDDTGRTSLQQAIGEPTRRGADIDGAASFHSDGESLDCVIELVAAASDIPLRIADEVHRFIRSDKCARLWIGHGSNPHPALRNGALRSGAAAQELATNQLGVETAAIGQSSPPAWLAMPSNSASS